MGLPSPPPPQTGESTELCYTSHTQSQKKKRGTMSLFFIFCTACLCSHSSQGICAVSFFSPTSMPEPFSLHLTSTWYLYTCTGCLTMVQQSSVAPIHFIRTIEYSQPFVLQPHHCASFCSFMCFVFIP